MIDTKTTNQLALNNGCKQGCAKNFVILAIIDVMLWIAHLQVSQSKLITSHKFY
jgi:hypothetical protein